MTTRADVVEAARAWLGTRWVHQGRTEFGIDCGGLVILVGRKLGQYAENFDVDGYGRRPNGWSFVQAFREVNDEKRKGQEVPGDLLVFNDGPYPCHTGIMSMKHGRPHMVHAYAGLRKVVEQELDAQWMRKLTHVFTYRQLED